MLTGKGIYIWKIKECEGGVISDIVTMCKNANFSHVIIKIADGVSGYNFTTEGGDMAKDLADALKAENIEPWGFQYIYGIEPVSEGIKALSRIEQTGVVGFVINAEQQVRDMPNAATYVSQYCHLKFGVPIVLSSYRYPDIHQGLPWKEFDKFVDFYMPQVYWMEAHNPAEQLAECIAQYRKFSDKPILPTGSAFCEHGWCPTNDEIERFAQAAKDFNLPGINFWEWSATRKDGFWKTVRDITWKFEPSPEPPVDCCGELEKRVDNFIIGYGEDYSELDKDLTKVEELTKENSIRLDNKATKAKLEEAVTAFDVWFKKNEDEIAKLEERIKDEYNVLYRRDNEHGAYCEYLDKEITKLREALDELETRMSNEYRELQNQINDIKLIEGGHKHPKWMLRLGLVK